MFPIYFSPHQRNIVCESMCISCDYGESKLQKDTDHEIKTNRSAFSLVSDTDAEKILLFNVELKFLINTF